MIPTRFAIMHAPRVGSTMLGAMLNNHPKVLCHNEIFNVEVIGYAHTLQAKAEAAQARRDKMVMGYAQTAEPEGFDLGGIEERDRDPAAFLRKIWDRPLGHTCLGLQMCWKQNETAYTALVDDAEVRKIILRRRNRVKFFVSWQIALKTRQWWVYEKDTLLAEKPKVEITLNALKKYVAFNEEYYQTLERQLEARGQSPLRLVYEDLLTPKSQDALLSFLELEREGELRPTTVKQNSRNLRDLIHNYDAFAAELQGTEYEPELLSMEN